MNHPLMDPTVETRPLMDPTAETRPPSPERKERKKWGSPSPPPITPANRNAAKANAAKLRDSLKPPKPTVSAASKAHNTRAFSPPRSPGQSQIDIPTGVAMLRKSKSGDSSKSPLATSGAGASVNTNSGTVTVETELQERGDIPKEVSNQNPKRPPRPSPRPAAATTAPSTNPAAKPARSLPVTPADMVGAMRSDLDSAKSTRERIAAEMRAMMMGP